jgi:hypothetical protein
VSFALLSSASIAHASTDAYLELQIDATKLAALIHAQVVDAATFCPIEIPCPTGNDTCVLDHVEVGAPGTIGRSATAASIPINDDLSLNAQKVLYRQNATLFVKRLDCSNNPSCGQAPLQYPIMIALEIKTDPVEGLCVTTEGFTGLPAGIPGVPLERCMDLDIEEFAEVTGLEDPVVSGSAAALNAAGTRVAMRFELNRAPVDYTQSRRNAWQSFLYGNIDTSGGSDWSMLVHHSLITSEVKRKIEAELAGTEDLEVVSDINVAWQGNASAGGLMTTHFDVELDTPCDIGVDAEVDISMTAALNAESNGIMTQGTFAYNEDEWDVFIAGLACGGPIGLNVAIYKALTFELELDAPEDCVASGDTLTCNEVTHPKTFSIAPGAVLSSFLHEAYGSAAGLTLRGTLQLPAAHPHWANISIFAPRFAAGGDCSTQSCGYTGGVLINGHTNICSVTFSNNVHNVFTWDDPELVPPVGINVTINPSATEAQRKAYQQGNENLWVTVATSVGRKTYEFPKSELLSAGQEQFRCSIEHELFVLEQCMIEQEMPWETYPEIWQPDYLYDPAEQTLAIVTNPLQQEIDRGIAQIRNIDVTRSLSGVVQSATVQATVHSRFGGRRHVTQHLTFNVTVPQNTREANNATLMGRLLPAGLRASRSVTSSLLPPGVSNAQVQIDLSLAQLSRAATR